MEGVWGQKCGTMWEVPALPPIPMILTINAYFDVLLKKQDAVKDNKVNVKFLITWIFQITASVLINRKRWRLYAIL